ncbi:MAG: IS630 family transposase [bacterium]
MPNRAVVISLTDEQRVALEERVKAKSSAARDVERARIVLLAAEGLPAKAIAERVGCGRGTVLLWRSRFAQHGLQALADAPRSGRPRELPPDIEEWIVAKTLKPPPKRLGITHWSSRLLARELGVSHETVARAWRRHGLKPHRRQTFKFSTDPQLEGTRHRGGDGVPCSEQPSLSSS